MLRFVNKKQDGFILVALSLTISMAALTATYVQLSATDPITIKRERKSNSSIFYLMAEDAIAGYKKIKSACPDTDTDNNGDGDATLATGFLPYNNLKTIGYDLNQLQIQYKKTNTNTCNTIRN